MSVHGSQISGRKYSGSSAHRGTGRLNSLERYSAVPARIALRPGLRNFGGGSAKKLAVQ
jgi:hypothetical protein